MKKKKKNSVNQVSFKTKIFSPYVILGGFIFIWWLLAFRSETSSYTLTFSSPQTFFISNTTLFKALSPLDRQTLKNALAGDFSLAIHLIEAWDEDAQFLITKGFKNISRIEKEKLFQAKILATLICDSSKEALHSLNSKISLKDDKEFITKIHHRHARFLPQTYTAASFLLAIADPQEIVALPKGMRQLTQIYSQEQMNQIPLDVEKLSCEGLYLQKPDLVLIAPYSNPSSLSSWKNQKLPLFCTGSLNSIEEITKALLTVGHVTNHLVQAQLLAIFLEAAFLTIDNRLEVFSNSIDMPCNDLKLLYLKYHQHFFIPTPHSLEGKILQRLFSHCKMFKGPLIPQSDEWIHSFEKEQITAFNPDIFFISLPRTKDTHEFKRHNLCSLLGASKKVCCVDEAIQSSTNQYIALAYFDLFESMTTL